MDISIYIPKLYTILLSSDLKTKKVPHPHPHPNKKKISAFNSEILIKYKRVNQMDPTRETLRLIASQGDKTKITEVNSEILIK